MSRVNGFFVTVIVYFFTAAAMDAVEDEDNRNEKGTDATIVT